MNGSIVSGPIHVITLVIDLLYAGLGVWLVKNIVSKKHPSVFTPFFISLSCLGALLFFYLSNTLEISNVWLNSHQDTPLLYKIAGLWGNHEGSMLLFYTLLCAWAALVLRSAETIRLASFVLLAIGLYSYVCANPFAILVIKAANGQDLNPALQNPYLAIHPPILYAGQTLCFVLWVKACVNACDHRLLAYSRLCFLLITLGLALGARWAYGELGWGGFWFWDPVETVSLFPWLVLLAAIHATEQNLRRSCLLLSFPMVMLGLTLVRSGVLVSVHSFGFDLNNGIWLGICTAAVVCITGLVFLKKARPHCEEQNDVTVQARYITLSFMGFLAILVGLILLPILIKITANTDLAIDEHFFHQYINPLIIIGLFFCGFAPSMQLHKAIGWNGLCAVLLTSIWCLVVQPYFHLLGAFAALVSFWIIISVTNHFKFLRTKGFVASHLGVALAILGASHSEIFTVKKEYPLTTLPPVFAGYPINYHSVTSQETPQMTKEIVNMVVGNTPLSPQLQHFHTSKTTKHQPDWIGQKLDHIHATCFVENQKWTVELMAKPLISLFWFGVALTLVGIMVSVVNFSKVLWVQKQP